MNLRRKSSTRRESGLRDFFEYKCFDPTVDGLLMGVPTALYNQCFAGIMFPED